MLTVTQPTWQAQLAADLARPAWTDADEQADDFNRLAREDETRRYPYGRPEQDMGWFWEKGNAP